MENSFDFKIAHLENVLSNKTYRKAMRTLTYEEKEILYFLAIEEFTIKELAKKLGVSTRAIRKRKRKAINHFQKNLKRLEKRSISNITLYKNLRGGNYGK